MLTGKRGVSPTARSRIELVCAEMRLVATECDDHRQRWTIGRPFQSSRTATTSPLDPFISNALPRCSGWLKTTTEVPTVTESPAQKTRTISSAFCHGRPLHWRRKLSGPSSSSSPPSPSRAARNASQGSSPALSSLCTASSSSAPLIRRGRIHHAADAAQCRVAARLRIQRAVAVLECFCHQGDPVG